jgi:hypothetical protein
VHLIFNTMFDCILQTWFYEDNKKAEIGNRKYWIYYKKGIATVKSGILKAEFRFKADENQVWYYHYHLRFYSFHKEQQTQHMIIDNNLSTWINLFLLAVFFSYPSSVTQNALTSQMTFDILRKTITWQSTVAIWTI